MKLAMVVKLEVQLQTKAHRFANYSLAFYRNNGGDNYFCSRAKYTIKLKKVVMPFVVCVDEPNACAV